MRYAAVANIEDLINAMFFLGGRFEIAQDQLALAPSDARNVGLGAMRGAIVGYAMGYAAIIHERETAVAVLDAFSGRKVGVPSHVDPQIIRNVVEHTWRLGLQSSVHFQVDGLFYNLNRELLYGQRESPKRAFQEATKQLLRLVGLSEEGQEFATLLVLAHLRNTLHNNGIHRNATTSRVVLNDMEFEFVRDQPITCASWQHVLAAIDATLDVLMQILQRERIRYIPGPIRDDFTE